MSSVTTQSFQVTQVFGGNASGIAGNRLQQEVPHPSGPKIIEMDLDTVEGVSNLDHTHQKGRSELAQRGSLGQRRPPTRAGIRAFASAVWEQDHEEGYSTVSSEDGCLLRQSPDVSFPKSSDCRDDPEGKEDEIEPLEEMSDGDKPSRGWKQPPKHAVLVFPMQLLNSNKYKETETVIRESEKSTSRIVIEEPSSVTSEKKVFGNPGKKTTTTVTITPESETDLSTSSSEDEVLVQKSKAQKRLSAPTIVSITLKEPVLKRGLSVESLLGDEPVKPLIKPTANPMIITFGDMHSKHFETKSHMETFKPTIKQDLSTFRENEGYTKEQNHQDDEDAHRSAGVQVRIKGRKPGSPIRDRKLDSPDFENAINPKNTESFSINKSSFFGQQELSYSGTSNQISSQHHGNTVVFIKPQLSPGTVRRSSADSPSPDRPIIPQRQKWNRNKSNTEEEEIKENLYNLQEAAAMSFSRERRSSVSSIDLHSVTSRESSKDDSPDRHNSKKIDRQPTHPGHQLAPNRVQIQTWDRRSQDPKSPSPSRSHIRQLVMSRGKSVSPLRPASVIGDDGETERFGRKEAVETVGFSSRRSSPTGHRYVGRPVLSEKENKPEWLKKIDLNRRKVIDWDNLGSPRKNSDGECCVSPTRLERLAESFDRSSDILDRSPTRFSEEFANHTRTWERSHSDSFLLEEEEIKEAKTKEAGTESLIKQEPEWIRIAEMRRRSSINWEEISVTRKGETVPKDLTKPTPLEDPTESHNVGVQVNFRRSESKTRSQSKERRSSPNRKSTSGSKIPRSSQEDSKSEANVIQTILSKVRASQEPIRSTELRSPEPPVLEPRAPEPVRSPEPNKVKSKEEAWSSPRSASPWRTGVQPPLYRWPDTEKEVVIEELPKANSKVERSERIRSPSPVSHQERVPRMRESREHKKERPRSMVNLSSQSSKRRPSPPAIPRSPSPRSSTSEPLWKTAPPSRSGRTARRQPSPDEHGSRTQGRVKVADLRRRSASYDKLSSMSSGSEHEGEDKALESGGDAPANKKKVRFLINRENGVILEKPQNDTTYTMFGMEQPPTNNPRRPKNEASVFHEVDLNRGSGLVRSGTPTEPSMTKSDPTSCLNEDDYQLQAYKIINHIKRLSKEGSEPPNRVPTPKGSREPSPVRPEPRRREATPEAGHGYQHSDQPRARMKEPSNSSSRHHSTERPVSRRPSKSSKTKEADLNLRRRDESPMSSDSSRKESSQSDTPATKLVGGRTPEWMKKALHKQKSPVDWESLERGANTESNKPLWAGVKLKKTPYSTKFLAENSDVENGENGGHYAYVYGSDCDGVAPYDSVFESGDYDDHRVSIHDGPLSVEELGDNEEVSLHVEKRRINNDEYEYLSSPEESKNHSPVMVRKVNGPSSRKARHTELHNGFHPNKKSEQAHNHQHHHHHTVLDSEGYSSMESCFSAKTPSCKHCGHSPEENSSNSSSLCNDIIEENGNMESTVNGSTSNLNGETNGWEKSCPTEKPPTVNTKKTARWFGDETQQQYSEPTLPPPPPLSVSLAMDPNCPQEYSNQLYNTLDFYPEPKVANKPRRSVSMRVTSNQDLSTAGNGIYYGEEEFKGKHHPPVRRNSLSETRQKLLDLLTTKSTKRGPQIKTIRKTIRRILRGTEVTDEEEEIVEEITEEVFGLPEKSSKNNTAKKQKGQSTITRTVHQTKDGRKFLTTTILDGNQLEDDSSDTTQQETPRAPVRVSAKRVQSEETM